MSIAPALAGTPAETSGNRATVREGVTPNTPNYVWRQIVRDNPRVFEYATYSPSMDRDIPLVVISPKDNSVPRPIVYVLNGGDGGEGRANWLAQSDIVKFYADKNVWVVIPMAGAFSYYTDWVSKAPALGGTQKWETYLTKELPGPLEQALGASSMRGIIGMSMSATTTLLYAEHHPGFYDAVGSFSGCAETSRGFPYEWLRLTLDRGSATPTQMWGPIDGEVFRYNDGLLNAQRLIPQRNLYVSNATGLPGPHEMLSDERAGSNMVALLNQSLTGGLIEAATNKCTHDLKAKLDSLGKTDVDWNFRPTGTHSWGYWQDDLRSSWPTFARAFGMDPGQPTPQSLMDVAPRLETEDFANMAAAARQLSELRTPTTRSNVATGEAVDSPAAALPEFDRSPAVEVIAPNGRLLRDSAPPTKQD